MCRYALPDAPVDLSGYDGIRMRVKGDGQRYKLGLKTAVSHTHKEGFYLM